jgi:hypothetical protein
VPAVSNLRNLAALLAATALVALSLAGAGRAATPPSFTNYAAPAPLGQNAGEPSIGVDWKTGKVSTRPVCRRSGSTSRARHRRGPTSRRS